MFHFPPPPQPPNVSEQVLTELADYYRQLIEYHQQAANWATEQLSHLEALLFPEERFSATQQVSWLANREESHNNGSGSLSGVRARLELPASEQLEAAPPKNSKLDNTITLTKAIAVLLEENRGTILHRDYLVRELYGNLSSEQLKLVTAEVEKALFKGESQGLWFELPDSPNCWTIDLKEIPDLAPETHEEEEESFEAKAPKAVELPTTTTAQEESVEAKLTQDTEPPLANKSTTKTTAEVAKSLRVSPEWCLQQKAKHPQQYQIGTHYFKDQHSRIQWTEVGIEQLRLEQSHSRSFNISSDALPTKEVSDRLGVSTDWILITRMKFADQFREGTHWRTDNQRRYYWTPAGVELLEEYRDQAKASPAKTKTTQSKLTSRRLPIPMLPQYQGLTRQKALEKLFEAHRGQILHLDKIMDELYGELQPQSASLARERLLKTLSSGKKQGKWASVPGQIACYTLDLSELT